MFLPPLPPAVHQLLVEGSVGVRWNGIVLPTRIPDEGPEAVGKFLEFTVPAELRLPGVTEFILWNNALGAELPYLGRIGVVIPTAAEVFEIQPSSDRLAAYAGADGTANRAGGHIDIFRLSTGALLESVAIPESQRVLTFTPDFAYAWVVEDQEQGRIARFHLASGQTDQHLQIMSGDETYTLTAQVDRDDPRIVIIGAASRFVSTARAYMDGLLLPNVLPESQVPPLWQSSDGRYLAGRQICDLDSALGFINCELISAARPLQAVAVWNDRMLTSGGQVYDRATGEQVHDFATSRLRATYVQATNRLVLLPDYASEVWIADADTFETVVRIQRPGLSIRTPSRLWLPDWVAMTVSATSSSTEETVPGILVGRRPELGPGPVITKEGVVHAATGKAGPIAPGEILSIYGLDLGPAAGAGPAIQIGQRLATEVERTQVLFDSVPGAILYTGPGQVNVVAPESVEGASTVDLQVLHHGLPSGRISIEVTRSSAGLFSYPAAGRFYAAALNAEGMVQGPGTPLERDRVAVLFATGVGLPVQETADRIATRAAVVPASPLITIGGRPAAVLYTGVSPGLTVALTQLNIIVPADAPTGDAVEVAIELDGKREGNVWVAVR